MARIAQSVRGLSRVSNVTISDADFTTLSGLMEGVTTLFKEMSTGGVDAPEPAQMRPMKFGVNRKIDHLSATVNCKHIDPTKHIGDLVADVALFDANYVSASAATGLRVIFA